MTFQTYLKDKGLSETTVGGYTRYLRDFTAWLERTSLTAAGFAYNDLLEYMQDLRTRERSHSTVRAMMCIIRHYCDMLVADGERNDNPAEGLYIRGAMRKVPANLITLQELELAYEQYSLQLNVEAGKKVMFGLLVYQGVTVSELSALEGRQLWIRERKVLIKAGSHGAERILPLREVQLPILETYLQAKKQRLGPLFVEARKPMISDRNVLNRVKHMIGQVRQLNPHIKTAVQIRSSVITHWLKEHHLRQVQYMAGHKYVSSTERYQTGRLEDLQSAVNRHHPLQ